MSGKSATRERPLLESRSYHLELRQFPHNVCRFNLSEPELRASVIEPWTHERWIEFGDRKWNPQQAKLTVIEGPRIPVEQLSIGRGWSIARREGQDVTAELLASARRDTAFAGAMPGVMPDAENLIADSLGLELLATLGAERVQLRRAWELTATRFPDSAPGECLVLAERAVASLLRARLIVLVLIDAAGDCEQVQEGRVESVVRRLDSWTGGDSSEQGPTASVWLSRA